MEQSRLMSVVEVVTGSVIAFVFALWMNYALLPMWGFTVKFSQSFGITVVFTLFGIARQYLVRRFFAVHVKRFAAYCQEMYDSLANLRYLT